MLALSIVEEIARLLDEGQLSQRKIAQRLNVGRATVSAIASGKRALYGKRAEPDEPDQVLQPAGRCPKCGYFVHAPCLVCRTREYRRGQRLLASLDGSRLPRRRLRRVEPMNRRPVCQARVA